MSDLWLNSPTGYPFAQKISKNDIGTLKSFLIGVTTDELIQDEIRAMSDAELWNTFEMNGFTFKETWEPPQDITLDQATAAWGRRSHV